MTRRSDVLRKRADWLAVLDAVYAPHDDEAIWISDLLDAFKPVFTCSDGVGLVAIEHDPDCRNVRVVANAPPVGSTLGSRDDLEALGAFSRRAVRTIFYPPIMTTSHSELEGLLDSTSRHMLAGWRKRWGLEDVVGLVTNPEPGVSAVLYSAVPRGTALARDERRRLTQIALHFESAFRLRRNPRVASGILQLSSAARLERAASEHAQALFAEMKNIEAAHRTKRHSAGVDTLGLWQALVAGRFSLVPRHVNGRREYVVLENAPRAQKLRALTPREIEVLASASRGIPGKLVAYGLGLSGPTISSALRSCAMKLGVASRMELLRVAAVLTRDPRMEASDETLTAAESDVLQLLREGLSNEQIARARSRSVRTIANQVASLLRKTQSSSRRALVATGR